MDVNYNLPNEGGGSSPQPSTSGSVRYDYDQSLTEEQKSTARENIGAISDSDIPDPQAAVLYDQEQSLTAEQQEQARENIGAASPGDIPEPVQSDWNENDSDDPAYIKNKPNIPTVNDATVTIKQGETTKGTFTLNQAGAATINIDPSTEPVQSDWNETDSTDPAFIKNKPTITQPENHQIVRNALASSQTYEPNEWVEVCRIEIPEDGAYQISSLVKPVKVSTVDGTTINVALRQKRNSDVTELAEIELQPNRVTGCMARAINALRGDILVIESYSTTQYGIQAQPSVGKAHATYLEAVRIGAIYQS